MTFGSELSVLDVQFLRHPGHRDASWEEKLAHLESLSVFRGIQYCYSYVELARAVG